MKKNKKDTLCSLDITPLCQLDIINLVDFELDGLQLSSHEVLVDDGGGNLNPNNLVRGVGESNGDLGHRDVCRCRGTSESWR